MQEAQFTQAVDKLDYSTPILRDHGQIGDLTQANGTAPNDGADSFMGIDTYHS